MILGGSDLLMYIQSISREKDLPFDQVLDIFADSLAQSAKRSSGDFREGDFRVSIDSETGNILAYRQWRVLDEEELMENPQNEIMLESAQQINPEAAVGDIVEKPFDIAYLEARQCVYSTKQNFNIRLRDADRKRLLDELLAHSEKLVSGQVLRVLRDTGDLIVEVMRLECRLPKNEIIPREILKIGDRIQAVIKEVNAEGPGQAVILSRARPEFLMLLFRRNVPEIEKGVLEIIKAVRDPGNRAKISVRTNDPRVDPVGTCVGIRGSRVQMVTNELNGERIDIIPWNEDPVDFVLEALKPAEIGRIIMDTNEQVMEVLVDPTKMAQAIGKNGINVRLASELTGWNLNLRTTEEYESHEQQRVKEQSEVLAQALNLDEEASRILFEEGFISLEHVAFAEEQELLEVPGFEIDAVRELQTRARECVDKAENELNEKMQKQESALIESIENNEEIQRALAQHDILTLSDFADLSKGELLEIIGMDEEDASRYIMQARKIAYSS